VPPEVVGLVAGVVGVGPGLTVPVDTGALGPGVGLGVGLAVGDEVEPVTGVVGVLSEPVGVVTADESPSEPSSPQAAAMTMVPATASNRGVERSDMAVSSKRIAPHVSGSKPVPGRTRQTTEG